MDYSYLFVSIIVIVVVVVVVVIKYTRICAAEMAVRYAALSAWRKVHVCHCTSLGGAT